MSLAGPANGEAVSNVVSSIAGEKARKMKESGQSEPEGASMITQARLMTPKSRVLKRFGQCPGQTSYFGFDFLLLIRTVKSAKSAGVIFIALRQVYIIHDDFALPSSKTFSNNAFVLSGHWAGIPWPVFSHLAYSTFTSPLVPSLVKPSTRCLEFTASTNASSSPVSTKILGTECAIFARRAGET